MFVFLMALGSDYNILVMSRIREETTAKRPLHEAIAVALNATGSTVTSAGLVLAATFAVVGLTGNSDQVRQLGVGISVGVLLDTFLVRTLLVPSLVALLGRWNWWPSRLACQTASAPEPAVELAPSGGA
jgi:RND superfamily putative drug exporter